MGPNAKKYIIAGVIALLVIIGVVSVTRSKLNGPSFISSTDTSAPPQKIAFNAPEEERAAVKYDSIQENVAKQDTSDPVFLGCIDERFKMCSKSEVMTTAGNFAEKMKFVTENKSNVSFIDCIDDSVNSCSDQAIRKKMETEPSDSLCERYADEVFKKNCYNEIYPKIAIAKDDIDACNKLTEVFYLNYCRDSYNLNKAIKTKEISLCDKLTSPDGAASCKNDFYSRVALDSGDITFCMKASDANVKSSCAQNYLQQKMVAKTFDECKKINDYGSYFEQKTLDNLYEQCVNRLINTKITELKSDTDKQAISDLQGACSLLKAQKAECLNRINTAQKMLSNKPAINTTPVPASPEIINSASSGSLSGSGAETKK